MAGSLSSTTTRASARSCWRCSSASGARRGRRPPAPRPSRSPSPSGRRSSSSTSASPGSRGMRSVTSSASGSAPRSGSSFSPAPAIEALDRVAGLLIGADDYIVKPFDPDGLVARIRAQLRKRERRGSGRVEPAASPLTAREREVLDLLAQGLDQNQIAKDCDQPEDQSPLTSSTCSRSSEHTAAPRPSPSRGGRPLGRTWRRTAHPLFELVRRAPSVATGCAGRAFPRRRSCFPAAHVL